MKEKDLRDYFAGLALQALIRKAPYRECPLDCEHKKSAAEGAYAYADAMLKARKQK